MRLLLLLECRHIGHVLVYVQQVLLLVPLLVARYLVTGS